MTSPSEIIPGDPGNRYLAAEQEAQDRPDLVALKCPECGTTKGNRSGKPFMNQQALAVHRRRKHDVRVPKRVRCEVCGKEHAWKYFNDTHALTHDPPARGIPIEAPIKSPAKKKVPDDQLADVKWDAAERVLKEPHDPLAELQLEAECVIAITEHLRKLSEVSRERVMLTLATHFHLPGGRKR